MPVWTVSSAGSGTRIRSISPPSSSRSTVAAPPSTVDLLDHRDPRQPQQAGQRHAGGAVDRVGGLHAAQHQVRRLLAHDRREQPRDRQRVEHLVGRQVDRAVGAHRQHGQQPFARLVVADRDRDDLAVARVVAQLERGLHRERVPLVEVPLERVLLDRAPVVCEVEVLVRRRHLLDRHHDLHLERPRQAEVLGDRVAGHLVRDRADLPQPRVAPVALHVGVGRVAHAAEDRDPQVGGLDRVFGGDDLGHARLQVAGLALR